MGDDLAVSIELSDAVDLLGVGERLQEEVMPNQQNQDRQRTEQEVPPAANVGIAILAIAGEEQIQTISNTGGESDCIAERVLRIKVEREALRGDDTDDEQHADNNRYDAQGAFDVDLFLQEDGSQNRRIDGAGVN